MTDDPREALIGIVLDALASDECSYTAAEQATDRIRAWALEPEQVERAAKAAYEKHATEITPDWPDTTGSEREQWIDEQRAALTALFGGSDDK